MKPIIPNPKEPWKVCPKQLAELDNHISINYPTAKIESGLKYARWAVLDDNCFVALNSDKFNPDFVFNGKVMGKEQTICMWLPFFD